MRHTREEVIQRTTLEFERLDHLVTSLEAWFSGQERKPGWPFDLDAHSSYHRVKDIEEALKNEHRQAKHKKIHCKTGFSQATQTKLQSSKKKPLMRSSISYIAWTKKR